MIIYDNNNKIEYDKSGFIYLKKKSIKITLNYQNTYILKDTTLWGKGRNRCGELGDNSTISKRSLIKIYGNNKYNIISAGYFQIHAIDINGKLWAWGINTHGELGDGTFINKSTPVAIMNDKTFCKLSEGFVSSGQLAIDNNGKLWAWGDNSTGSNGNGTFINTSIPVAVVDMGICINEISSGNSFHLALDTNGKIYSWGYNNFGQLGNNDSSDGESYPNYIGGVNNYCKIACGDGNSMALDNKGQVWTWGYNFYGQLGNNTPLWEQTYSKIPVSIHGIKKTFNYISSTFNTSYAIDHYGQLWQWGNSDNSLFEVASNDDYLKLQTPIKVATDKTFCDIYCGSPFSIAVDNNNKIWSWGNNDYGQLINEIKNNP